MLSYKIHNQSHNHYHAHYHHYNIYSIFYENPFVRYLRDKYYTNKNHLNHL